MPKVVNVAPPVLQKLVGQTYYCESKNTTFEITEDDLKHPTTYSIGQHTDTEDIPAIICPCGGHVMADSKGKPMHLRRHGYDV